MTQGPSIFQPLLDFLAGAGVTTPQANPLEFRTDGAPTSLDDLDMDSLGNDAYFRFCCSLGVPSFSTSVDMSELGAPAPTDPHRYEAVLSNRIFGQQGGGKVGYVYTRRGGFVDLGHLRDHMDYTRLFTGKYIEAAGKPLAEPIWTEGGDVHLVARPPSVPLVPALAAVIGARLSYQRAVWHEIGTYLPELYIKDQRFSSFAPDDNFSNALGAVAGYNAVLDRGVPFDLAADKALVAVLEALRPATKEQTDRAKEYVKGFWYSSGGFFSLPAALRRNFGAFDTIEPWLVTDVAVPGNETDGERLRAELGRAEPAHVVLPTHYNGVPLDDVAYFEIRNVHPSIAGLVPGLATVTTRDRDLRLLTEAVRERARADSGDPQVDQPGPPAP